jgi:hypothetical protein
VGKERRKWRVAEVGQGAISHSAAPRRSSLHCVNGRRRKRKISNHHSAYLSRERLGWKLWISRQAESTSSTRTPSGKSLTRASDGFWPKYSTSRLRTAWRRRELMSGEQTRGWITHHNLGQRPLASTHSVAKERRWFWGIVSHVLEDLSNAEHHPVASTKRARATQSSHGGERQPRFKERGSKERKGADGDEEGTSHIGHGAGRARKRRASVIVQDAPKGNVIVLG